MRPELIRLAKAILLATVCCLVMPLHADDTQSIRAKLADEQKIAADAKVERDAAQKNYDAAFAALQASPANLDSKRKLDDAEYALRMADYKLDSATKAAERTQRKVDESSGSQPKVAAESKPVVEKPDVDAAQKAADEQAKKKEAEAKLAVEHAAEAEAAQKASVEAAAMAAQKAKAAEEQAKKEEAEARFASEKAASEKAASEKAASEKAAEEKVAAQKKAAVEANMNSGKCMALPAAPTNPSTDVNATEQAYAQGFVKQVDLLVAKKSADDAAPISPAPMLEGSKLNPCDPDQKQALHFAYLGNGQYRLETPVLAGQQTFSVAGVVAPLERTIPDADNGETYVFFLDGREGRTKLLAYKKSLIETPAQ